MLIDLGLDVNYIHHRSALHQAAWHGRIHMIKCFLMPAQILRCETARTLLQPLGWALQHNQTEAIEFLDHQAMDIFSLVARGKTQRLETLLRAEPALLNVTFFDIRPNQTKPCNADWMTPLGSAVANNQLDCAELLLKHGAKTDVVDESGRTLLEIATDNKNRGMADFVEMMTFFNFVQD